MSDHKGDAAFNFGRGMADPIRVSRKKRLARRRGGAEKFLKELRDLRVSARDIFMLMETLTSTCWQNVQFPAILQNKHAKVSTL